MIKLLSYLLHLLMKKFERQYFQSRVLDARDMMGLRLNFFKCIGKLWVWILLKEFKDFSRRVLFLRNGIIQWWCYFTRWRIQLRLLNFVPLVCAILFKNVLQNVPPVECKKVLPTLMVDNYSLLLFPADICRILLS